jgi:diacylglycerol kinase (ATP)
MTNGWLAIVNPRSGAGAEQPSFRPILESLERVVEKIVFTEGAGHARELASRASGYGGLAVVGGDGTLHEVLGADRRAEHLALVPTGRGNSLARDLGLTNASAGVDAIGSRRLARVDLIDVRLEDQSGRRHACRSASTVALGYPVAVTVRADRSFRFAGGYCYLAAAIVESAGQAPFEIEVAYDGAAKSTRRVTGLIANNTRHVANFDAFPDARYDDGWLDVMELDAGFVRQNLHNISALCGSRLGSSSRPFHARRIEARLVQPASVMVDGQIYTAVARLEIQIVPAALICHRQAIGAAA